VVIATTRPHRFIVWPVLLTKLPARTSISRINCIYRYCNSVYAAAESADAIVIATEWAQFRFVAVERPGVD
jgi:UDP-glucose 6-dehydrogenase